MPAIAGPAAAPMVNPMLRRALASRSSPWGFAAAAAATLARVRAVIPSAPPRAARQMTGAREKLVTS